MQNEKRHQPRFDAIGRVEAKEICIFPGTLLNISSTGCRVRFPNNVIIDTEEEYELKITFCQNSETKEMILLGQPMNEIFGSTSEIGFKLLRSPDSKMLESFIESFKSEQEELDDDYIYHAEFEKII